VWLWWLVEMSSLFQLTTCCPACCDQCVLRHVYPPHLDRSLCACFTQWQRWSVRRARCWCWLWVCVCVCWRCYDMIRDSSKLEFHCVSWQQACRYMFIFTFIFVENSITTVIHTVYTQPPRLPGLVDDSLCVHICCMGALLGDHCWWWCSLGDMSTADDVITMCTRSRCDVIIFCCLLAVTWYTHALTGQWRHHACPTCDDTNNNNSLRLELREIIAGM